MIEKFRILMIYTYIQCIFHQILRRLSGEDKLPRRKAYGRGFEYVSEDLRVEETQENVLHLIKPRKIRIEPKTRPIVCKQVSE